MNIFQMSVQASLMILAVVVVRALGMGKLPKWSFQVLWAMVLARLLVPFSIESPLSVYGLIGQSGSATALQTAPVVEANNAWLGGANGWWIAWIAGALLVGTSIVVRHMRARRIYAQSLPAFMREIGARRVAVRVSDRIKSPLTYGVMRPIVLLPKRLGAQGDALDYVLTHEFTHVRHFDVLKKWLLALALCVHWFNPLVWAMCILAGRDIELMCDEAVVRAFGGGSRAAYATMLIDQMETRRELTPLASHFSKDATHERIAQIMKYKRSSMLAGALALALIFATAAVLATDPMKVDVVSLSVSVADYAVVQRPEEEVYLVNAASTRPASSDGTNYQVLTITARPAQTLPLSGEYEIVSYSSSPLAEYADVTVAEPVYFGDTLAIEAVQLSEWTATREAD